MAVGEAPVLELDNSAVAASMEADITSRAKHIHENGGILPTLAILSDNYIEGTPTHKYINLKTRVGQKMGVAVIADIGLHPEALESRIDYYNQRPDVHGIIVQLPLISLEEASHEERVAQTDAILETIDPEKDVDGLGPDSPYKPATPLGILSLLEGNGIDYLNRPTVVRGLGRLVGKPLITIMQERGAKHLSGFDADTSPGEMKKLLNAAEVIISATGHAGGLTPDLFDSSGPKVVVDAGTAEQKGVVVGDVADELRTWGKEHGWIFTSKRSGAGKLTVLNLLSHVVTAAENAKPVSSTPRQREWRFYFQTPPVHAAIT